MAMTAKENYRAVLNGEWGEWVPVHKSDCEWVIPSFYMRFMATPEKRDMFGVPWAINANGPMPDTTKPPVIDDMEDWRQVVNLPDLDAVDWEQMAAFDLGRIDPDRMALVFTCAGPAGNFFLPIMAMLGFVNGLMSFYDSPEAVHEFCEYMTEYYLRVIDLEEKYYDPEVYCIADDMATANAPFISMDVYDEFLKPYYKRLIERCKSYGKKVEFHLCGKAEPIISDLFDMGVDIWQAAQWMNDLEGLRGKYGSRITFNGAWDTEGPANMEGADEQTCRQAVRNSIDRLVALGPSVFMGSALGEGPIIEQQNKWILDEAYTYGREAVARAKAQAKYA